jgi:hypothetical protein
MSPPVVGEHDEDEQDLEGDRGDDEEVHRHEVPHVVLEEGPPRRRRRLPRPDPVALATWMPSLASSPTIRGDPQDGLALDIRRIRSRISLATAGLPGALRDSLAQWSRNLRRCQAMTVEGLTKTRALRQPAHARESQDQSSRSASRVRVRGCCRW